MTRVASRLYGRLCFVDNGFLLCFFLLFVCEGVSCDITRGVGLTAETLVFVIWESLNGCFAIVPEHVSPDRGEGDEKEDGEWRGETMKRIRRWCDHLRRRTKVSSWPCWDDGMGKMVTQLITIKMVGK